MNPAPTSLIHEALSHWEATTIVPTTTDFAKCTGGVNNFVWYIPTTDKTYVLRIYNNSGNTKRVVWEHEILNRLKKFKFSFQIPYPHVSTSGETYVRLSNGDYASLFDLIPGKLPKLTLVKVCVTRV